MSLTLVRVIHITWMTIAVIVGGYAGLLGLQLKYKNTAFGRWLPFRYNRKNHLNAGLSFLTMLFVGSPLGLYSSYLKHGSVFNEPGILIASAILLLLFFTACYYGLLMMRYGYDKRRARVHSALNALGFVFVLVALGFALAALFR